MNLANYDLSDEAVRKNMAGAAGGEGDDGEKSAAFRRVGEGEDDGSEKLAFRWLDVARCAVAAVVAVLILAVIVNAIKAVLRPNSLRLTVAGGSIHVRSLLTMKQEKALAFYLNVRAENPSNRARMYYVNITASLFVTDTLASTGADPTRYSMIYYPMNDIVVLDQQGADDASLKLTGTRENMLPPYFDVLYNRTNANITDVTLRLDGNLITQVTIRNDTAPTTYYCRSLVIGGDPQDESFTMGDVKCDWKRM